MVFNHQDKLICDIWSAFGLVSNLSSCRTYSWNSSNEILCNSSYSILNGVECQEEKIIGISLESYGIVGTLSPSFGNLSDLLYINLNHNSIYGTVPSSFGRLKKLVELELNDNLISGTIPITIGYMESLQTLDISSNMISGIIPSSIGNIIKLITLYTSENYLTGNIPSTIGLLTSLVNLRLYANYLTGTLPSALGRLKSIQKISIGSNFFSGSIPSSLGLLETLTGLSVGSNKISGTVPSSMGLLSKVLLFYLFQNNLVGTLPTTLGFLSLVVAIRLDFNKFSGTMPSTIGYLTNLYYFNPSVNQLNGSIPSSLGLLSNTIEELYLNDNCLSGSIPQSLGNLMTLTYFDFQKNRLTGALPDCIWSLEALVGFDVHINSLTGTIASTFGNSSNLLAFYLGYNSFSGTLPTTISSLSSITTINIESNHFIGPIPSAIGMLTNLEALMLNGNSLTGTIPSTFMSLTKLKTIFLFSNQLTGSLPEGIFSSSSLQYLDVYDNRITGTLSSRLMNCTLMQRLVVTDTLIHGTLPSEIGYLTNLQYLYLSANHLTGTLPSTIGRLKQLQYLDLHSNAFHGTLPSSLSSLSVLVDLYLRGNLLEGPISQAINTSHQCMLRNIDVSENYLTGTIPSELFFSSTLVILAATSNCLVFPELADGCTASKLHMLSLDGIRTASRCRKFFWSDVKSSETYYLEYERVTSVPDCLFTLPRLSVLHLSGNALSGTIPADVALGPNLRELTLSYNRLHGPIPEVIQARNWTTLDLSFNSLSGTLSTTMPTVSNTKLALTINRLSGLVPPSLLESSDISILRGNVFQCDFNRARLPSGDHESSLYSCGSDTFLLALYIFFGSLLIAYFVYLILQHLTWVVGSDLSYILTENGTEMSKFIIKICSLSIALTVYILLVMMPAYGALSRHYGTHSYQYAWSVSAGYLSGGTAIVVMLLVWSVMLVLFLICYYRLFKSPNAKGAKGAVSPILSLEPVMDMNPRGLLWDNTVLAALFLINIVVVFGANAAYVFTTLRGDATAVIMSQILLGIFKLIWRYGYIEYIGYYRDWITGHTHRNKHELLFLTLMLILNNVVMPVFSETVVDTNCIYNMFVAPDPVTSSYDYEVCLGDSFTATVLSVSVECLVITNNYVDISYVPPFIYRYQCSATILTNYVSVYCYMYVLTALQIPLSSIVVWFRNTLRKGSFLCRIISLGIHQLHEDPPYLNYPLYVAGLLSNLAVLVTFGAAFPPLALIIMIAIYVDAAHTIQLLPPESAAVPIDDLRITVYLVPFSALFFCFFLYDATDYQKDVWSSLWAPFVILLIPIFYYVVVVVYIRLSRITVNYMIRKQQSTVNLSSSGDANQHIGRSSDNLIGILSTVGLSVKTEVPPISKDCEGEVIVDITDIYDLNDALITEQNCMCKKSNHVTSQRNTLDIEISQDPVTPEDPDTNIDIRTAEIAS